MSHNRNDFGEKKGEGKKGFYLSLCTALLCLMAVGTVYYRTNHPSSDHHAESELANESVSVPQSTSAGSSAISGETQVAEGNQTDATEESQEVSAVINSGDEKNASDEKKQKSQKTDTKNSAKKNEKSDADKEKENKATMSNGTDGNQLAFQEEKGLLWPVKGDVIMKYSKNNTVYFKTLAQYRCNPAIEISAKEGTKVVAAAKGTVTDISKSEETGTSVTMNIGSGYEVVYGQLKDVKVTTGQNIKEGETIGLVAAPTKYFTEEGSNLYFQVLQKDETVDPLLLLR